MWHAAFGGTIGRVLFAASITLGTPLAAPLTVEQSVAPSARILLEQLERGEYDVVQRTFKDLLVAGPAGRSSRLEQFKKLGREFDTLVPGWVTEADTAARERRWRVASALAVEGASVGYRGYLSAAIDWLNIGLRIRQAHPAPDFDRQWYLAALAIVEGSRQSDLIDQFVKVARIALPNESALDLSRAFAIELRFPDRQLANRPPTPLPDLAPRREPDLTLLEARNAFERLRDRPLIDGEATLRMGRVAARLRESDTAIQLLGSVPRLTGEPDLVHLSLLFQGEIYERTGRTREAVAAYRAALTAVPRARTATQTLADLLLETSERQEGTVLAADARTYSAALDPWYRYMDGSMRKWPERVARLRESLDT